MNNCILTKAKKFFLCFFVTLLISTNALAKTDLVFVVDGSGSISNADFALQKTGITAALEDRTAFPLDSTIAISVVQLFSFLI